MSMPCCGQILYDSFQTYETFPRNIITEFGRKIMNLGGYVFSIVFLLLNNDDEKYNKNSIVN